MNLLFPHRLVLMVAAMLLSIFVVGQNSLDSLEASANRAVGEEKLDLLLQLSENYLKINPDRTLDFGLQVLVQAKKLGKPLQEAQALWIMGKANFKIANLENALRYYNRALGQFEKFNMREEQVNILIGLSEVYENAPNPEMALVFLDRAYSLAVQLKDNNLQTTVLMNLGQTHIKKGSYRNAIVQYNRILQIVGDVNLTDEKKTIKTSCYGKIGLSYKNLGEFQQSREAYEKASRLAKSFGDSSEYGKAQREIALSFYLVQKMDSSMIYYTKALNISSSLKDSLEILNALQGIGDVNFEIGKYDQAKYYFNRQLIIAEQIKNVDGIVTSLVKISRCYYVSGDYPTSSTYLNRALAIAKSKNLTSTAADVYKYLSLISESEGRYRDALAFYKSWADIRDSIYNEEGGEKLAKLQILYDISQKERENEILRQGSEIQKLQISKNRYQSIILISVAVTLFVLIIFLAFLYQSKHKEVRKQKEAEQRIVEINKELERRMILEIKKQEKQQQLLSQKSKLESLGTLAAGIAHEINQPLGGISMGLDNILLKINDKNYTDSYLKEKISSLFNNVDRIKRIIDHIRIFSRTQKPNALERVDVNEVISSALLMVNAQYQTHNVIIETKLSKGECTIIGDKFKLEQVVLNLLSNAKHAADEKDRQHCDENYQKRIVVKSWISDQNVCFSVWDNGIGIHPDILEKIYDPFFTTKNEEKGTGLGLSIAYGFIKDILGEIRVESNIGEFTNFEIIIPKQ
ncbi:MAG: tetratricopeptide repeat protein [Bacteroidales bacterium]|nr:tetratricopeptide repeat protein [Bacteroidales bacterium]